MDEDIIENNECLLSAALGTAVVDVACLKHARVTSLADLDIGEPSCCCREHSYDCAVVVALEHV